MNPKNLAIAITSVIIGVVICTSVLIPSISGLDYGRTTYNNNSVITGVYSISNTTEDFSFEFYNGGVRGTLGGDAVDFPIKTRENFIIASDKVVFIESYSGAPTKSAYGWFFNDEGTATNYISAAAAIGGVLAFDADTMTVTYDKGDIHYSATVSWIYHLDPNGPYRTYQTSAPWYANIDNLVVAGGGNYTTGDNDTTYSFYAFNGDDVVVSGPYEGELHLSSESVAENIIKCTLKVDIGGEEFTPWNVIIPITVTSTENSTLEAIINLIPLLVLTGLVIGAVGYFVRNRD